MELSSGFQDPLSVLPRARPWVGADLLSLPEMRPGANAFEISDLQDR